MLAFTQWVHMALSPYLLFPEVYFPQRDNYSSSFQVGKGRDVGLNQIALFEGKVAGGNGEQVLSRDVYRLGQLFDFFRMLTFFFTTVGYYVCTMVLPPSSLSCFLCTWVYFVVTGLFCRILCVYWVLSMAS